MVEAGPQPEPTAAAHRWRCVAAAAGVALFYLATQPVNRTEAEDAYGFAWAVERARWSELIHPHHLFYLPAMRVLYGAVTALAPNVRALDVMAAVGALAAGAGVVMIGSLLRRLGVERRRAVGAAAGLALSYGFWRYAAEAEIYAPAIALTLAAWRQAANGDRRWRSEAAAALYGGAAICTHIFAVLPVLGAIPLWTWRTRGGWRSAIRPAAGVAAVAALAYVAAGRLPVHEVGGPDPLRSEGGWRAVAAPKAAIALGHSLVAGNFVFGEPRIADALRSLFPARMLDEELFLGQAIPVGWRQAAWATLGLAAAAAAAAIGSAAIAMRRRRAGPGRAEFQGLETGEAGSSKDWKLALGSAACWFGAHAALLLWMEPGNPELWVMALPPLWMAVGAAAEGCALPATHLGAAVVALGLHNWVGGLSPLRRADGDYNAARAAAVVAIAQPGDTIWTAGGTVFARYLRYQTQAAVVDLWADPAPPMPAAGRALVLGDVARPPAALARRFPHSAARIRETYERISGRLKPLVDTPFGGVAMLADDR